MDSEQTFKTGDVIKCTGSMWDRFGVVGLPDYRDRLVVWFEIEHPATGEPALKSWTLEQIEREAKRDGFEIVLVKSDIIVGGTIADTAKQIRELGRYRDRLILEAIRKEKK